MVDDILRSLGIGELAAGVFVQSWNRHGEGAVEHLRRYAEPPGADWAFSEFAYDAQCLLRSPLTAEELELLWCWCTDGVYRPSREGMSGREWIEAVHAIMSRRGDPAAVERFVRGADDPAVISLVESIVGRFDVHEEHDFSQCPITAELAPDILRRLASAGYPDLALRLFVSLVASHFMQVPGSLFRDIEKASRELGWPDYFLEGIDFLIQADG